MNPQEDSDTLSPKRIGEELKIDFLFGSRKKEEV
jgi:hypothetical protein